VFIVSIFDVCSSIVQCKTSSGFKASSGFLTPNSLKTLNGVIIQQFCDTNTSENSAL